MKLHLSPTEMWKNELLFFKCVFLESYPPNSTDAVGRRSLWLASMECVVHISGPAASASASALLRASSAILQQGLAKVAPPSSCIRLNFVPQGKWLTGTRWAPCVQRPSVELKATSCPSPVAQGSEFAEKEAARFREDLLKQLEQDDSLGELRGRIADTCTRVFKNFAEIYSGTLPPQPFINMKAALEQEGLPSDLAVRAAIGWSRGYLYHDWKQWSSTGQ